MAAFFCGRTWVFAGGFRRQAKARAQVSCFDQTYRRRPFSLTIREESPKGGVIVPIPHRLPDLATTTGSWTLYCTECAHAMTMTKIAAVAPGRRMRTYVCACGHSERITVTVTPTDSGPGYTSFQERNHTDK